ncbi:MATE family efflux transporter [Terrisporobacter mayombei]|uniref:Multidrug export protein MepA n=1 Tax=Terrisporobacter mayombei TaxID=1541 RepID=A0ABY9Q0U9_9FIRM|nr:MATE family efflux transporter [Terrisporobacter mayombei]MCC3866652.1 MATE family efflux transporter [Terrisporobacter mayombei]WMT80889.1 Multidrug export protein MepA [Terrisporobacter mayombei]
MKELKIKFMKYVSLNVMGMIGISCYILADTLFVSKSLGTVGLASLNFSIPVFSIIQGIGLMIGIGGATDYSINEQQKISNNTSFTQSLYLGGIMSIIFVLLGAFFAKELSTLLGADEATLSLTKTYLATIMLFAPFFICNNILLAFIRNDNNPKLSMIAMLTSSLANIILDYVFMFPFSMGIFGAALATSLSPIISLCILSIHFIKKNQNIHFVKSKILFSKIYHIMTLGLSSLIGELTSAISLITFNLIILRIDGNTGVAAYGIVANVALIATSIFTGISQGIQPLSSEYYGKGDMMLVNRILRYSMTTTIIFAVLIYTTVYIFTNQIVAIFNSEHNMKLMIIASQGMKIYFLGYLFAGINIVSSAFFSSISNAKQGMTISILRSALILIPTVLFLSIIFKMDGIWYSFVITELVVFIISSIFLIKMKNKYKEVV